MEILVRLDIERGTSENIALRACPGNIYSVKIQRPQTYGNQEEDYAT